MLSHNPTLKDIAAYILVNGAYGNHHSGLDEAVAEFKLNNDEYQELAGLLSSAKISVEWPEEES